MTLLFRYIFKSHSRLMLLTLGIGIGLFVLTELVERIDGFSDAGIGLNAVVLYFVAKLPGIVAQILPAVFLFASVIHLCVMGSSRETVALQAGGISPTSIAASLVLCGFFWAAAQFACAQMLAGTGERYASRIWMEQVQKKDIQKQSVANVWFTDTQSIVHLGSIQENGHGTDFRAYMLSPDEQDFESILKAKNFVGEAGHWKLYDVERVFPSTFTYEHFDSLDLPLKQSPRFFFLGTQDKPQQLPFWMLKEAIEALRTAGSNVEALQTAWHGKLAYACSIIVMAMVAAAIVSWKNNVYLAVVLAIIVTFLSYAMTTIGETMGQKGLMPPAVAAWGTDAFLLVLAWLRLHYVSVRR